MMKNIFYMIMTAWAVASCSKSGIETWDAKPCVWFEKANDTLLFSFYSQPGAEEYIVELPLRMAGALSETDRPVAVKDLGSSPHNPGSEYEIVSALIPARQSEGVLRIKVRKTENLNAANDTIGLEICASEVFEIGLADNVRNAVIISNSLGKPAWWNSQVDQVLGFYSDKKLSIIYEQGVYEIFSEAKSWWSDEIKIVVFKLNRYCKENNIKYHETDPDVIQFDFWTD